MSGNKCSRPESDKTFIIECPVTPAADKKSGTSMFLKNLLNQVVFQSCRLVQTGSNFLVTASSLLIVCGPMTNRY